MQPHFGIADTHKGVLPSLNLKRGASKPGFENAESKEDKAKRMNLMYSNPTVPGDSREALAKSVLAGLNPDAKRGKHPADDEALDWMRNERKRQEERAEKRWRAKFQEWVAKSNIPGLGDGSCGCRRGVRKDQGGDAAMLDSFEGSPTALRKSASSGAVLADREAGGDTVARLEEYCRRLRKDLASERKTREATHRQLEDIAADRDSWRLKAAQLEEELQQARSQKRCAGKKVSDLGRLLGELGAAPAEPPTPASLASPAAAHGGSSDFNTSPLLPPATPPAVGPPPARPAAETVTEPAEEMDGEEDQTYEADEEAPDSPAAPASVPTSPAVAAEVVAAVTSSAVGVRGGEAASTKPEGAEDESMYQSAE